MPDDVKPASPLPKLYAYFTTHGDPYIITDPQCSRTSRLAQISTGADDYGRGACEAIVAACNAYPGLVARVAALEAENARMRQAVVHGINHLDAAATVADDKTFVKWARQLASEMRAKMETADV